MIWHLPEEGHEDRRYWADDERDVEDDLPDMKRNARKGKEPKGLARRPRFRGGDDSMSFARRPTTSREKLQALDYRNGIAITAVEPFRKGNQERQIGTGRCVRTRPAIPSFYVLDEYKTTSLGTPRKVAPLLAPGNWCEYGWLRFSVSYGSIKDLAEHRSRHWSRLVQMHSYKGLDHFRTTEAFLAVLKHQYELPGERWDRDRLVRMMSGQGASPGEWRLVKTYDRNTRGLLSELRRGVKGAENEFPGIGRKSVEKLRDHLHALMCTLFCKYGIELPLYSYLGQSRRQYSLDMRCQACMDLKRSLLECIGQCPCSPCIQAGLRCCPRHKPTPSELDGLRTSLLRTAASKHLRPPATAS